MPKFEPFYERPGIFSMRIEVVEPKKWNDLLVMDKLFIENYAHLFRDAVLQSHKYLIRVTPFETGRLRAGWSAYLEKEREDYSSSFLDTSLINSERPAPESTAIQEGKGLSSFQEKSLDVTVTNSVPYGQYNEYGTSKMAAQNFTSRAFYKAEYIFTKALEAWSKKCSEAGLIVEPDKMADVTA